MLKTQTHIHTSCVSFCLSLLITLLTLSLLSIHHCVLLPDLLWSATGLCMLPFILMPPFLPAALPPPDLPPLALLSTIYLPCGLDVLFFTLWRFYLYLPVHRPVSSVESAWSSLLLYRCSSLVFFLSLSFFQSLFLSLSLSLSAVVLVNCQQVMVPFSVL